MATFMRGLEVGLGVVGVGYGIYRLSRGKRDWVTSTVLTSGVSMTMAGLAMNRRNRKLVNQVTNLVGAVTGGAPRFTRKAMQMAPQIIEDVSDMAMRAMR